MKCLVQPTYEEKKKITKGNKDVEVQINWFQRRRGQSKREARSGELAHDIIFHTNSRSCIYAFYQIWDKLRKASTWRYQINLGNSNGGASAMEAARESIIPFVGYLPRRRT